MQSRERGTERVREKERWGWGCSLHTKTIEDKLKWLREAKVTKNKRVQNVSQICWTRVERAAGGGASCEHRTV